MTNTSYKRRATEINIDLTHEPDGYLLVAHFGERVVIHRGPDFTITLRPSQVAKLIHRLECPFRTE